MSSTVSPTLGRIPNFRDLGSIDGGSHIKEGLLFRSARIDSATQDDRDQLVSTYGIKTIIDLRSRTEHIKAAKQHSDAIALARSTAAPLSDSVIATPLKISGIRYAEISLTGKGFERALLWKLRWSSLTKLVSLMALGYRDEGIHILGKEVMQPRGLVGLGTDTLDYSGKEIKEVLHILADESSYPALVHCTQGKDRTGLIILLVLLLCDVHLPAITKDYVQSERELQNEMKERLEEIARIGLDESFAGCPPDFVDRVVRHLDQRYGGVRAYLSRIGVSDEEQARIRALLRVKKS